MRYNLSEARRTSGNSPAPHHEAEAASLSHAMATRGTIVKGVLIEKPLSNGEDGGQARVGVAHFSHSENGSFEPESGTVTGVQTADLAAPCGEHGDGRADGAYRMTQSATMGTWEPVPSSHYGMGQPAPDAATRGRRVHSSAGEVPATKGPSPRKETEVGAREMPESKADIAKLQTRLATKAQAEPMHRFDNLYNLVWNEVWLREALRRVLANDGSKTAGVDGQTRTPFREEAYCDWFIHDLSQSLRSHQYQPQPVRRVHIPKRNGKKRPIGIPTVRDRVVQIVYKMILEPIYESDFLDCSSGFRPNRCTMDAVGTVFRHINDHQKFFWVVEGDITGCFDHIQHRKLIGILKDRILDKRVIDLISAFLRAGVMEGQLFQRTTEGTPQGGIVSPLLANIYLHEFDKWWWNRYGGLSPNERWRRRSKHLGNVVLKRYADDFILLCNGDRQAAENVKAEAKTFLAEMLGLELNEDKTRITHVDDGLDFLGFNIRRYHEPNGPTVTLAKPSKENIKRFRDKVNKVIHVSTQDVSERLVILQLNALVTGWMNYYRYASASKVANTLDFWVNDRFLRWTMRKRKWGIRQAIAHYVHRQNGTRNNIMVKGHDGTPLWLRLMRDIKIRRYPLTKKGNPYLNGWSTGVAEMETPLAPVTLIYEGKREGFDNVRGVAATTQ
jgi:RNA-directed DNA polymerase